MHASSWAQRAVSYSTPYHAGVDLMDTGMPFVSNRAVDDPFAMAAMQAESKRFHRQAIQVVGGDKYIEIIDDLPDDDEARIAMLPPPPVAAAAPPKPPLTRQQKRDQEGLRKQLATLHTKLEEDEKSVFHLLNDVKTAKRILDWGSYEAELTKLNNSTIPEFQPIGSIPVYFFDILFQAACFDGPKMLSAQENLDFSERQLQHKLKNVEIPNSKVNYNTSVQNVSASLRVRTDRRRKKQNVSSTTTTTQSDDDVGSTPIRPSTLSGSIFSTPFDAPTTSSTPSSLSSILKSPLNLIWNASNYIFGTQQTPIPSSTVKNPPVSPPDPLETPTRKLDFGSLTE
jgi:hypothetical protein